MLDNSVCGVRDATCDGLMRRVRFVCWITKYGGVRDATCDGLMRRVRFVCWVTKYGGVKDATGDGLMRRVRFVCWVTKYGGVRDATGDGIMRRVRFVCWITKNTDARSEHVMLFSHGNGGYANVPQCYTYIACLGAVIFDCNSNISCRRPCDGTFFCVCR